MSNPTYDTRRVGLRSQCLHLQELVKNGLGAANFLPECTHDMVRYTMVKTTKKNLSETFEIRVCRKKGGAS